VQSVLHPGFSCPDLSGSVGVGIVRHRVQAGISIRQRRHVEDHVGGTHRGVHRALCPGRSRTLHRVFVLGSAEVSQSGLNPRREDVHCCKGQLTSRPRDFATRFTKIVPRPQLCRRSLPLQFDPEKLAISAKRKSSRIDILPIAIDRGEVKD
jgi:hypothetical protein